MKKRIGETTEIVLDVGLGQRNKSIIVIFSIHENCDATQDRK
jgi:hypothetical protein